MHKFAHGISHLSRRRAFFSSVRLGRGATRKRGDMDRS